MRRLWDIATLLDFTLLKHHRIELRNARKNLGEKSIKDKHSANSPEKKRSMLKAQK